MRKIWTQNWRGSAPAFDVTLDGVGWFGIEDRVQNLRLSRPDPILNGLKAQVDRACRNAASKQTHCLGPISSRSTGYRAALAGRACRISAENGGCGGFSHGLQPRQRTGPRLPGRGVYPLSQMWA